MHFRDYKLPDRVIRKNSLGSQFRRKFNKEEIISIRHSPAPVTPTAEQGEVHCTVLAVAGAWNEISAFHSSGDGLSVAKLLVVSWNEIWWNQIFTKRKRQLCDKKKDKRLLLSQGQREGTYRGGFGIYMSSPSVSPLVSWWHINSGTCIQIASNLMFNWTLPLIYEVLCGNSTFGDIFITKIDIGQELCLRKIQKNVNKLQLLGLRRCIIDNNLFSDTFRPHSLFLLR